MFAAHIKDQDEQSVQAHCEETAAYAKESGLVIGVGAAMYLAGLLHDLGKYNEAFNEYIHNGERSAKKINHSSAGAKYLLESFTAETPDERLTQQLIAYAIVSHHGLNDCLSCDGRDKYQTRIEPETNIFYDEVLKNSEMFLEEHDIPSLYSEACGEVGQLKEKIGRIAEKMGTEKPIQEKTFMYGCLARIMLSMLMDADRRNTAEYMIGNIPQRLDTEQRVQYFSECLKKLNNRLDNFVIKNYIDELRNEMSDQCAAFAEKNGSGVYKLPIPTGGGKTYSSMRFALKLAVRERKERIIYTAPFLSVLEQNAQDIRNVFGDSDNILEYHSNVVFDENTDSEEMKNYELLSDEWSSPVIMTTMVRLLEVLFGGSTMDVRRMHSLKNSVIIIDEAQSVPVRYIHMFNTMINFLSGVCGTTVVLCTATQPIFESVKRPLLYSENSSIISDIEKYSAAFKRVDIVADHARIRNGTDSLCEFILHNTNKNSLVILNTKSAVQKLYEGMEERLSNEYRLIQLTTYMCAKHRLDLIEDMKAALENDQKIICISTQLIEAGVDISFETVFRSLSGLDNIAQAAGRCNRNGKAECIGKTYIICYDEEKVSSLEDIRESQNAMRTCLDKYHGEDLLMPESLCNYYKQYFFDRMNDMDAPAQKYGEQYDIQQSLYSFLGSNAVAKNEYKKNYGRKYSRPMPQSFKTAADLFSSIGKTNSVGVIVYYRDSKKLINRLYKETDFQEKKKILKQLQRYTVDVMISSKLFRELCEISAFEMLISGGSVLILTEKAYSRQKGVTAEILPIII